MSSPGVDLGLAARPGATLGEGMAGAIPRPRGAGHGARLRQRVVARSHSRRDSQTRRLLLLADLAGICCGLLVATLLISDHPGELL